MRKFTIGEVVTYIGAVKSIGSVILSSGAKVEVTTTFNEFYYVYFNGEIFQCVADDLRRRGKL